MQSRTREESPKKGSRRRPAFTLVEMLVVITIIGILIAMVVPAVAAAVRIAQDTAVMVEVSKLDAAMKNFESKFDRLPPDGSSSHDLNRFIDKAFVERTDNAAKPPDDLNPARALVFWLSQVSTDETNPFGPPAAKGGPSGPKAAHDFFSFSTDRVRGGLYYPKYSDPKVDPPYVYFCAATYGKASYTVGRQRIRPYHYGPSAGGKSHALSYAAPDAFQIIAAGRDKDFGRGGRVYSETANSADDLIAVEDEDNIVNFDTRQVGDIRR